MLRQARKLQLRPRSSSTHCTKYHVLIMKLVPLFPRTDFFVFSPLRNCLLHHVKGVQRMLDSNHHICKLQSALSRTSQILFLSLKEIVRLRNDSSGPVSGARVKK